MQRFLRILAFTLLLLPAIRSAAQTKFRLGINAAGIISRNTPSDTFPTNFSARKRIGIGGGIVGQYELRRAITLQFGVNYIGKGYKINCDTLNSSPSVTKRVNTINVPIGIVFKQNFNSTNYILEKFGFAGSFALGKSTSTTNNSANFTKFRIVEKRVNPIYPMFYLGFGMGGSSENGDRFEFAVTYFQSFSKDAALTVQHGTNFNKSFPLSYRGGFLNIGFSYYFNLVNFKKSSDYFE